MNCPTDQYLYDMSNYKRYFIKQMGVGESLKPSDIQPSDIDSKELEMGVEDEKDHTSDPDIAKTIALQHLAKTPDYYSRMKKAGLEEVGTEEPSQQSPLQLMSPSAISTPVIAMAVRGSSTGGLPSGADREMSLSQSDGVDVSQLSPSQLGGYEPVPTAKDNSKLIGKTPNNPQINSSALKVDSPDTQINPHPFQFQKAQGEPPQDITGASTDSDDSLTLKMAMPKGIDVDIQEDDEYGNDESNHKDNPEFQKKNEEEFRKSRSASPVGDEIRKSMGINETFARHLKLMNETIEARNLAECSCGPDCECNGGKDCECDVCKPEKEKEKEKVEEKYSAPFAKMRGLANLGERRVSKNGLWESSHKPGENFTTHWKMDKEKAGMVKIDEKKLLSVKENLSKKTTLTEKEERLFNLINKKIEESKHTFDTNHLFKVAMEYAKKRYGNNVDIKYEGFAMNGRPYFTVTRENIPVGKLYWDKDVSLRGGASWSYSDDSTGGGLSSFPRNNAIKDPVIKVSPDKYQAGL